MRPVRDNSNIRGRVVASLAMIGACVLSLLAGCSPVFWRNQADRDTYHVLERKMTDPRWDLPRFDVQPHPMSRFFDPFSPDCGPLPPDDPAAQCYMDALSGKCWHKYGRSFSVENPHWLEPYGLTPEMIQCAGGTCPQPLPEITDLQIPQALEIANINNREFQTRIEDLYLSALDLTFERFQFVVRYVGIGGDEPGADVTFESVPDGQNSVTANTSFGISRLLPTGGQWAVELANNTLWLFTGPDQTATSSALSYSLVQPLLQGAGRQVVLENLTQSERSVLYAARDLARFRRIFFTDTVSGYLDQLGQIQLIENQRDNIDRLVQQVEVLQALASERPAEMSERLAVMPPDFVIPPDFAGRLRHDPAQGLLFWRGGMTPQEEEQLLELSSDPAYRAAVRELGRQLTTQTVTLEVAQLQSRLANSQNALRSFERALQDSLDRYKLQLGLPTNMNVTIDKSLLKPFELIDPRLAALEQRINDFADEWNNINTEDPQAVELERILRGMQALHAQLDREGLALLTDDVKRVNANMNQRLARLKTKADRETIQQSVDRSLRLMDGVKTEYTTYGETIAVQLERVRQILAGEIADPAEERLARLRVYEAALNVRGQLLKLSQNIEGIEVGLRVELITLNPFTMGLDEAVCTGLANRLDLMNAKANVVDARRRVEVAANALQAVLDVVVEGDVATPVGTRPLEFRGDQSSFRAGLRFTGPLDQVAERNEYRAAQIAYQRARRDYMELEDVVKEQIRRAWRQLSVLEANFETARLAVRLAALQYDNVVESTRDPAARTGRNSGLDLLNALQSVLDAQNDLIGIWVLYEQNRLNIYRDMDIMEIDSHGIWHDAFYLRLLGAEGQLHEFNRTGSQPALPVRPVGAQPAGVAAQEWQRTPVAGIHGVGAPLPVVPIGQALGEHAPVAGGDAAAVGGWRSAGVPGGQ